MKLIEAMKKIKDYLIKAADLREKVKLNAADLDYEAPQYGDEQRQIVAGWIQAHTDLLQEIARLRLAIQWTNLSTMVTIELAGKFVVKSIAEWILRRGTKQRRLPLGGGYDGLAALDYEMWAQTSEPVITARGLKEARMKTSGEQIKDVHVRRYFDPVERDRKMAEYKSEAAQIDAALEVANATTDLLA